MGTSVTVIPWRAALSRQGWIPAGCSMLDISTSSPAPSSSPLATKFIPSVVFRVRTTSSGDALMNPASFVLTSSRRRGRKPYTSQGLVHWTLNALTSVLKTGSGIGPTVPLFIMISPAANM